MTKLSLRSLLASVRAVCVLGMGGLQSSSKIIAFYKGSGLHLLML